MPKRSNLFQRLIYLIHRASPNCRVTESVMLDDKVTGEKREVDILVIAPIGVISKSETTIAVECIDHKRKADVSWVEKMVGKYLHVQVDSVVLVSRKGFSK